MTTKLCATAILSLALAFSAAPACAQDAQAKLDKLATMQGAERQKFLEAEAEKEGKVVIYCTDSPDLVRAWNEAFSKKYPKIQAQFVRMSTPDLVQRSIAEGKAGKTVADVLHPPAVELAILRKAALLAKYVSPEAADFRPEYKDKDGLWTQHWLMPELVGYNTNLVKREQVPTTLEALADPSLKGKLARASTGGRWVAAVLKARGETDGMELVKKIAANNPRLYESHSAVANVLSSGQVPLGFDLHFSEIGIAKSKGAPIDYVVPDLIFIVPIYQAMTKDAPHPYAGALAYDFVLTKEGQAPYVPLYQIGPRNDVAYPGVDIIKNAKQTVIEDDVLLADPDRYNKIFEDLYIRK